MSKFSKYANHMQNRPEFSRQGIRSRILGPIGLGVMAVTVIFILSGCGSDSKPQLVSGKKEKAAKATKPQVTLQPMNIYEVSDPGTVKRAPNTASKGEILPGAGVTMEELQKRMEAARKVSESPNYEIYPGITRQVLEAKQAANQAELKRRESANDEIYPGITRQQLEAKQAAHQAELKRRESTSNEIVPGITRQELEAKIRVDHIKSASANREVYPGITKAELDAKNRAAKE
jgi:hypothetical protein